MAPKIQVKRGSKAGLPPLSPGEFGLATDTDELYIGGGNGNIQISFKDDLTNHINNKNNPHGVTADQAGAIPAVGTYYGPGTAEGAPDTSTSASMVVYLSSSVNSELYNALNGASWAHIIQIFYREQVADTAKTQIAVGSNAKIASRYRASDGSWTAWSAVAAADHTHAANQVQVSGGSSVEEALEAKISHTDEFTAEMQDLHGNARGLLCTVPSYAGPESASINAPPDVNWGTCLSLQVGSIRTLMLIDSSGLWIQYYNGEGWSAWQKMLSASSPDVVRLGCVSRVGLGTQSAQNPSTVVFGAEPLMWYVVERGALSGRNNYFFHGKVSGSDIWLANDSINTMSMSWSGNTLSYCHNNGSIWDNAGTTYDFYYFYK